MSGAGEKSAQRINIGNRAAARVLMRNKKYRQRPKAK